MKVPLPHVCLDSNLSAVFAFVFAGGYLFAVVDPLETLVQFGLRIGPAAGTGQSELSLYHTHPEDRFVSKVGNHQFAICIKLNTLCVFL